MIMDEKGQTQSLSVRSKSNDLSTLVLDKTIFNKVFEKDVRRVYLYKKAERIAKAIHLVTPAFKESRPLRERLQRCVVELIDASSKPITEGKEALTRELLSLMSILSMARSTAILSPMNVELITREISTLLQDIAAYEDPRISLEEVPTLSRLQKEIPQQKEVTSSPEKKPVVSKGQDKGQQVERVSRTSRKEAIVSVLKTKGPSSIKDISGVIRDVSEKTIQRELQTLVEEGSVSKKGERRWTIYSLTGS